MPDRALRRRGVARPARTAASLFAVLSAAWLAGCAAIPPSPPPSALVEAPAAPEFAVAAVMLDTWNALGQLLVNTPGVTYRSRSQMMGLYDVEYRGQRILLLTRAHVLDDGTRTPSTLVQATRTDGKPDTSPAARDLLLQIQNRISDELQRLASQPQPQPTTPARKRGKHR